MGKTPDSSTRALWQSYQQRHLGASGGMDEVMRSCPFELKSKIILKALVIEQDLMIRKSILLCMLIRSSHGSHADFFYCRELVAVIW
jgi:hypothetical protein